MKEERDMMRVVPLAEIPPARQIVAVRWRGGISNDPEFFARAMAALASWRPEEGREHHGVELLDRWRMRFMAACDLGVEWERLAEGPTFFGLGEDGFPVLVEGGVWKPKAKEAA